MSAAVEVSADVLTPAYESEQAQVAARLSEIFEAARAKDVERLERLHAFGPKFTKFDDFEPLERQLAETTRRLEREAILGVDEFGVELSDLKIDVLGRVAIATFVLDYDVRIGDERLTPRARGTLVFVCQDAEWLIVHEHFSAFKANP